MGTTYETTYNSNGQLTSNNIPYANDEPGAFLSLTDVALNSKIDVQKFLKGSARKILVTFNDSGSNANTADLKINSMTRTLKRNIESADTIARTWGSANSLTIQSSSTGSGTWNSYTVIGDISINSLEISAVSTSVGNGSCTIDLIIVP